MLLKRKRAAVSGNAEMSRLINARRVMDITFTKGEDVSGLELFASYFRGHAMSKVVTAL